MRTAMTLEVRLKQMVETPVPRVAIPTVISMLVTAGFSMADIFFVSQIGTRNYILRSLGNRDEEAAFRAGATEMILPGLFSISGPHLAQPAADLCTFVMLSVIVFSILKELRFLGNRKLQNLQGLPAV